MTTPPGWEPRPGPTSGDPARRTPRGDGGWAHDGADSQRQGQRGNGASPSSPGGGRNGSPSFTPGRGSGGPRDPRRPADDFEGGPRSSRPGRPAGGGRPRPDGDNLAYGGPANGLNALQSGGVTRFIGRMSTRTAMLVLAAGALLGIIFTVLADQEPGNLLGFFVIMGSLAAVLGVQRGRIYLLFPAPALAFFVAAVVAGKVHDAKLGSSTAATGVGFTQWIAGIFFPAVVATILVLLIGGGRWLLGRQLITGQSMLAQGGPPPRAPRAPRPAPREPRPAPPPRRPARNDDPDRDSWADDNPFEGQSAFQTQMMPAATDDRPSRKDRDQWGEPRTGPRPNAQPRDRAPRPGTAPRPSQGSAPRPAQGSAPRPSFNPNQRPKRPNPPESWGPR